MKFLQSITLMAVFSISRLYAQTENNLELQEPSNPPINMEVLVGSRGVMYQLIVNKKFKSIPKLGFFSVTNGTGAWTKESPADIMTQAHITYSISKRLNVTAGMQYYPNYGFRPVTSLMYTYSKPDLLFILNPKIDIASDFASENMVMVEYKPKINNQFNFYSRVQGLYGFVPKSGAHNRSYLMLRAGLTYKEFTFGLATNFDRYGPSKQEENNFGIFINTLLF
ncbi:hypothetical protein [Chryseobacterium gleum]|uniref:hypothetical protein n=1 Tax=Chryseobacterium gleum TaxID=250 RepID=UPI0028B17105|nr:hypothetical protein [Chryseobacterium gleum]